MCRLVIIALLCHLCLSKSVVDLKGNNDTYIRRKARGFLFSMPKTLVSGKNETVCITLHEANLPAKILIDLKWKEKHHTTLKTLHSDSSCIQMNIPLKKNLEPQFVSVRVQVQINGDIYSAHNHDPILMYPSQRNKVYIETDRGIYKPGDNVKFMILELDNNFLPVTRPISDIRIKNPMGITVMMWENVTPDHGLISLDYQMVQEALTGKWKLQVENQTRYFEVAKYNVPRFKMDIKYPKLLYYKAESMNIHVCGRYSHNKPVAGIAFIKISDSSNNMDTINKLNEMINGCTEFKINKTELGLDRIKENTYDSKIYIHITAMITEYGTNKMDVATGKSKIVLKGYSLKFVGSPMFIPGIPYTGQLKLTNPITNTEKDVIEICYNLAIKKSWNYFNNEQCQNYSVAANGVVPFNLWPFKNSVLHVHLHARSINNSLIADNFLIVRLFSPSSSYIHLEKDTLEASECNTDYQYKISYSSDNFQDGDNITFYYMVKSSTEILETGKYFHTVHKVVPDHLNNDTAYLGKVHKFVKLGATTDHFILNFQISKKFISRYQLLVYYVTKDGETVAATKSDEIVPCSFQVNSFWSQNQVLPGTLATLNVKSNSSALCAVSATDKASTFMAPNHQTINLEQVLKTFPSNRESARSGRNSCVFANKKNKGSSVTQNSENGPDRLLDLRRKRHTYSFSEDYDAYDIFSRFGTITITNLQVVTKPCYTGALVNDSYQVQFLTDHYETAPEDDSKVTIRSHFPENWLWELFPVSKSVQLQREVPHSVTNWVTNVFCVSESEGIGFTKETELSSFQGFFIDVLTSYSMKKGENFSLLVHVFNYFNYSFPIRISIRMSDNLELTHKISGIYCLTENSTITHNYPLTATETGIANLTVMAETEGQYPLPCGPDITISKRDVVFKTFKIEPEGHFMVNTKSVLLCASKQKYENNVTWNLRLPKDIVTGTDKVTVTINADLLGQTIENLHQLLTIPTGCGEQIVASMAPNIYVLRYLAATGGLTPSIKQRIIRNLKMGYQRILNYLHPDGSFSAFGYYDPSGSMFLTAFVVKVLQEASEFIYVDQRLISKAVNWMFSHQLENGCFDTMHHVFQDMGGTNIENSTAGLTAYVILSLFDAKVNVPDTVQTNAKYCIRGQFNPDKYSLVISSYALFKVQWISEARRFLQKAIAAANMENDFMWWSNRGNDESYASDIEITSYALLAIMEQKSAENLAYAHSIVQWLVSKMSPTGGFKSTQDTIVALDALTKYAVHIHNYSLNLSINLESDQESYVFHIKEVDRLKSKQVILHNQEGEVKVSLSGSGCALAQLTISYFTTNISESEAFKLAVEVSPVSNIDECSIKSITPCVAYEGPDKLSSMAVMEIALPSGFSADRGTLYELVDAKNDKNNIKMFEEKDNQVNFYFTNLGKNQICFSFNINENIPVENRKESLVKLYDYYRPEQSILQFYRIINNCSRNTIDSGLQEIVQSDSKPNAYTGQAILERSFSASTANSSEEDLLNLQNIMPGPKSDIETRKCAYFGENRTEESNILLYEKDISQEDDDQLQSPIQQLPECIQLPLKKERLKRNALETKSKSRKVAESYKDFVDVSAEPETTNCMNIPFYTLYDRSPTTRNKSNLTWIRYRRYTGGNINKDFVDLDIEMETPSCINVPFYSPFSYARKNESNEHSDNQGGDILPHSTRAPHPLQRGG